MVYVRNTGMETPTAVVGGAEARLMKREWARYEGMLGAIGDPSTPESYVAKRAHKRLAQLSADLKLSSMGVVELANQVSTRPLSPKGPEGFNLLPMVLFAYCARACCLRCFL